jgi:hypothetical protein
MAAKYWIKLYHEILEDSKMGRLPDNLWRRAIELFLMAGEVDNQGQLPCTGEIAWRLRLPEEMLEDELSRLESLGILTKNAAGWLVTNFAKRQAPTETIDRVRQFRQRQRAQPDPPVNNEVVTGIENVGYAQETKSYTDTDTDTESSTNVEGASPPPAEKISIPKRSRPQEVPAARIFVEVTGKYVLNNTQIREIDERIGRDPPALEKWRETVKAWQLAGNKINGIKGMLDWFRDGIPVYKQNGAMNNGHYSKRKQSTRTPIIPPEADQAMYRRMAAAHATADDP